MKKVLAILAFSALGLLAPVNANSIYNSDTKIESSQQETVYICTGSSAKRYHKSADCTGLNKCTKEIRKVSLSEAKSMGRTPCHICYEKN